jgi:sulfate transport system ATP-binding protein
MSASQLFTLPLWRSAWIDDIEVEAPEHAEAEEQEAVAYVRPHDIEIERVAGSDAALRARVTHVLSIGPSVRLELILEGGGHRAPIQAEISKERFRELKLIQGDSVFIRPRRFDLFPNQIH